MLHVNKIKARNLRMNIKNDQRFPAHGLLLLVSPAPSPRSPWVSVISEEFGESLFIKSFFWFIPAPLISLNSSLPNSKHFFTKTSECRNQDQDSWNLDTLPSGSGQGGVGGEDATPQSPDSNNIPLPYDTIPMLSYPPAHNAP